MVSGRYHRRSSKSLRMCDWFVNVNEFGRNDDVGVQDNGEFTIPGRFHPEVPSLAGREFSLSYRLNAGERYQGLCGAAIAVVSQFIAVSGLSASEREVAATT